MEVPQWIIASGCRLMISRLAHAHIWIPIVGSTERLTSRFGPRENVPGSDDRCVTASIQMGTILLLRRGLNRRLLLCGLSHFGSIPGNPLVLWNG